MIRKYQYGGPGYFLGGVTAKDLNEGTKKVARPGLFFTGLASTPLVLIGYNNYQQSKKANARKSKKANTIKKRSASTIYTNR